MNITPPKLSICISSYNQIEYLKNNLEAIEKQMIAYPYEIIVCDDGSNDGSYEWLQEYKPLYCQNYILLKQERTDSIKEYANWRHARVIIRMLKEVHGEYFILLDGDDYLCGDNTVNEKIAILDDIQNQDCIICMGNMQRVFDDGHVELAVHSALPVKRSLEETFFHYNGNWNPDPYLHIACGIVRSKVIPSLREELCQDIADWSVYFWIMNYGKRYYQHKVCFTYRIHEGTIWSGEKQALSSMRNLLSDDARNIWWDNRYSKSLLLEHYYNFRDIFKIRKRLSSVIDTNLWRDCVDRYPGVVKKFFIYDHAGIIKRLELDMFFYKKLICGFAHWMIIGVNNRLWKE